jgi:hypothetical protein
MSAPVFSFNANGRLVQPFTRAQLSAATRLQPLPSHIKPDLAPLLNQFAPPRRGDLDKISEWFLLNDSAARWEKDNQRAKPKQTDDLIRTFLVQQIDNERQRRAKIESNAEMPFAGVMRDELNRKDLVDQSTPQLKAKRKRDREMEEEALMEREIFLRERKLAEKERKLDELEARRTPAKAPGRPARGAGAGANIERYLKPTDLGKSLVLSTPSESSADETDAAVNRLVNEAIPVPAQSAAMGGAGAASALGGTPRPQTRGGKK